MNKKIYKKIILFSVFFFFLFFSKVSGYEMLEPLPGVGSNGSVSGLGEYLTGGFKLIMAATFVLAIFQISRGGVMYMISESIMKKQGGKELIQKAFWGLILLLSSYLILKTINPELVNTNFAIKNVGGGASQINNTPLAETEDSSYQSFDERVNLDTQQSHATETQTENEAAGNCVSAISGQKTSCLNLNQNTSEKNNSLPPLPQANDSQKANLKYDLADNTMDKNDGCPNKTGYTLRAKDLNNKICYYNK